MTSLPERRLASAVINRAYEDFEQQFSERKDKRTLTRSNARESTLRRLREAISAGEFLVEQSDKDMAGFWFSAAEISLDKVRHRHPEWRWRLAALRAYEKKLRQAR